jgi:hypothetical protein
MAVVFPDVPLPRSTWSFRSRHFSESGSTSAITQARSIVLLVRTCQTTPMKSSIVNRPMTAVEQAFM